MAHDINADRVKLTDASSIRLDRAIRAFKRSLDADMAKTRADANLNTQVTFLTTEEFAVYVKRTEKMSQAQGRS